MLRLDAHQLSGWYPALGPIRSVEIFSPPFAVSNALFRIESAAGGYIAKVITEPKSLYGTDDADKRLELYAAVAEHLEQPTEAEQKAGRTGLGVEHLVPNRLGSKVTNWNGAILRVYHYEPGESFDGSDRSADAAARALLTFHERGSNLRSDLVASLQTLKAPYPLSETRQRASAIRSMALTSSHPSFQTLESDWGVILWALAFTDRPQTESTRSTVLHLDAHPRNWIFGTVPTLIDLDNLMWGPPDKCLAFAALRFGLFSMTEHSSEAERRQSLVASTHRFLGPISIGALWRAMVEVELEKVLRIILRTTDTGHYGHFGPNLGKIHLPNLASLRDILS